MAEITATAVKQLRQKTGLPLMDCKIGPRRIRGRRIAGHRAAAQARRRRYGQAARSGHLLRPLRDLQRRRSPRGAIVELKCESAPVASNDEFIQLANDLAQQLATGPGAVSGDELLDQPSPSKPGVTLREQKDELFNRIREVFNVGRMRRVEGATGGYSHNSGTVSGVLLSIEGGNDAAAKDVCMHIAAMRPAVLRKEDIPAEVIAKEREILREAALDEGKPETIVDKMVDGRLRNFFAERVLLEQPFVKDDKQTISAFAAANGMKVRSFVHWELGEG